MSYRPITNRPISHLKNSNLFHISDSSMMSHHSHSSLINNESLFVMSMIHIGLILFLFLQYDSY